MEFLDRFLPELFAAAFGIELALLLFSVSRRPAPRPQASVKGDCSLLSARPVVLPSAEETAASVERFRRAVRRVLPLLTGRDKRGIDGSSSTVYPPDETWRTSR